MKRADRSSRADEDDETTCRKTTRQTEQRKWKLRSSTC